MARSTVCGVALVALLGCASEHARDTGDAGSGGGAETIEEVTFDEAGLAPVVAIDVPPGARSVTIWIEGDPESIFALASLRTADGIEHIGPGARPPTTVLFATYPWLLAEGLHQFPR